ncbi:MAG: 2Fe-2S iron-sulfur cluster-binding protein, partial [Thermodesulfobacteriota bacterium]
MPKLTIDGMGIEVEEGLNIIQAASRVGIEIPHFCYHPALSIVAQCR